MNSSLRPLSPLLFLLLLPGCSPIPSPESAPFADDPKLLVVSETPGPLATDPAVPVLAPPQVFPVWVPSHVDRERDLLVGEHWVFFKLTESEWFTEKRLADAVPAAKGTVTCGDLAPLRSLAGFDRAVVPYRESK